MRTFWFLLFEAQMLIITLVLVLGWVGMLAHMRRVEASITALTNALRRDP